MWFKPRNGTNKSHGKFVRFEKAVQIAQGIAMAEKKAQEMMEETHTVNKDCPHNSTHTE